MMKDLLANSNFKAIEPDVRADSVDDPKLGIWRQCDDREYTDFDIDPKTFYGGLEQLGAPPYRYYRIELDNNPKNGPEDLIYHEHIVEHPSNTLTGYTWVNLKKCEIMDNFIVEGSANWSEKPDAAYLNTLVYYKRKLWILDFVDGFDLHLSRRIDRSSMDICRWRLYLPN